MSVNKPEKRRDYLLPGREGLLRMRAMFVTWLTLIAAGLIFFTIIGLSHH